MLAFIGEARRSALTAVDSGDWGSEGGDESVAENGRRRAPSPCGPDTVKDLLKCGDWERCAALLSRSPQAATQPLAVLEALVEEL